ncbi:MAG TPA: methyltransferase domain-containing protein, partial [Casimicrobiaceae bacterium]|nr:methyltransferase domain-containing protein [Casimicrobiaceae bacterium]
LVMAGPTRDFWQQRFVANETPWDRGTASPQLATWLASGTLAPCRILVPGCGGGHEVVALARAGFDVTALDYAPAAITLTRERLGQANLRATLVQADALEWQPAAPFDAIYEQTCLCALHPEHWRAYADRLDAWLAPGGRLYSLWMQVFRSGAAEGLVEGPPYHCDINALRALFLSSRWEWPPPPYTRVLHPRGWAELAVVLVHRMATAASA